MGASGSSSSSIKKKTKAAGRMSSGKVAVVLSGCGVFDGSEVHETAAACAELARQGKTPVFFAPDKKMYHEVILYATRRDDRYLMCITHCCLSYVYILGEPRERRERRHGAQRPGRGRQDC